MEGKSGLAVFGQDPGLSSLCYLAWARWLLGFPDQALAPCEESVKLARHIGKPVFIAIVTGFAGLTYSMRGDISKLAEYAEEYHVICEQHEFRQWAAMSNVMLAYAYLHLAEHDRAIALAESGLNEKPALQSYIACPWFCYLSAEVYLAAGRLPEALEVARRGIDFSARGAERFFESENHRIQGVILSNDTGETQDKIESHFNDALQLARNQKAMSLEVRAATSSARFAVEHGMRDFALELPSSNLRFIQRRLRHTELNESESSDRRAVLTSACNGTGCYYLKFRSSKEHIFLAATSFILQPQSKCEKCGKARACREAARHHGSRRCILPLATRIGA